MSLPRVMYTVVSNIDVTVSYIDQGMNAHLAFY